MPSFRFSNCRLLVRNTLKGFASGHLDAGGGVVLALDELTIHERDGRSWVGWPARPLIGRDGAVMKDENGRTRYAPALLRPVARDVAQRLESVIVAAVRRAHPAALDAEEAGSHGRR